MNTAVRLDGAAKQLGAQAIVSCDVTMNADERHRFIARGEIQLRGKATAVEAFEFDVEPPNPQTSPLELIG